MSLDFNAAMSMLYISAYDANSIYNGVVYSCPLDAAGNIMGSCTHAPTAIDFSTFPANLLTRNNNNLYYLPSIDSSYIEVCDPSFSDCSSTVSFSSGSVWTTRF